MAPVLHLAALVLLVTPTGPALALDDGQGVGGRMEFWGALTELRSCTDEILLFSLNGAGCCRAMLTVTRHCWPAMLASVGFTAEEADVTA